MPRTGNWCAWGTTRRYEGRGGLICLSVGYPRQAMGTAGTRHAEASVTPAPIAGPSGSCGCPGVERGPGSDALSPGTRRQASGAHGARHAGTRVAAGPSACPSAPLDRQRGQLGRATPGRVSHQHQLPVRRGLGGCPGVERGPGSEALSPARVDRQVVRVGHDTPVRGSRRGPSACQSACQDRQWARPRRDTPRRVSHQHQLPVRCCGGGWAGAVSGESSPGAPGVGVRAVRRRSPGVRSRRPARAWPFVPLVRTVGALRRASWPGRRRGRPSPGRSP